MIHLWYDDTYWSKSLPSSILTSHSLSSCKGQGHSHVKIFMLKSYIKVFRTSLLLNQTTDLIYIWYHDIYWSKVFISTISTRDLWVKVTDLEFLKC